MKISALIIMLALLLAWYAVAISTPVHKTVTGNNNSTTMSYQPSVPVNTDKSGVPDYRGGPFHDLKAFAFISPEVNHPALSVKPDPVWTLFTSVVTDPDIFHLFELSEAQKPSLGRLYETFGYDRTVESSIDYFSRRKRYSFSQQLGRVARYGELIANIFSERGLPPELLYLPLIESSYNAFAYSPKRAAGLWQFIPSTARKFGLKIDWWVDERRDPVKSTRAAAEYLYNLYNKFGNWGLALAAYNAGEGRISRAINKVDEKSYWRIQKSAHIPRETKNYVPSFIAAASIGIEPGRFGFAEVQYQEAFKYDSVAIDTPMDLAVVAHLTGVKTSVIKKLNPELRRWCTPPNVARYILKIPEGTKDMFLANLSNTEERDLFYITFYKVKKGDTVWNIARRLRSGIQAIMDVNSLGAQARIIEGETILVPVDRERHTGTNLRPLRPILKYRNI
jgi:membrane-bound lytic murein transglycosylase D